MNANITNFCASLLCFGTTLLPTGCGREEAGDHHRVAVPAIDMSAGQSPASADTIGAHQAATRLDFTSEPRALRAGLPARWTMKIVDAATGRPFERFAAVHEKPLHLIVVAADLSWFNHLHPTYSGAGVFTVTTQLPRDGRYVIFADIAPEGRPQQVIRHTIAAGTDTAVAFSGANMADAPAADGWIVKRVTAAPEGQPDARGGAEYEVALMPMPETLVVGNEALLHFQVRDRAGRPVTDLEPYLGALGHAVIISDDTRTFLHAHPAEDAPHGASNGSAHGPAHGPAHGAAAHEHPDVKSGGPDVRFNTSFPGPGRYKIWGQFRHRGSIITAAATVHVRPAASS